MTGESTRQIQIVAPEILHELLALAVKRGVRPLELAERARPLVDAICSSTADLGLTDGERAVVAARIIEAVVGRQGEPVRGCLEVLLCLSDEAYEKTLTERYALIASALRLTIETVSHSRQPLCD